MARTGCALLFCIVVLAGGAGAQAPPAQGSLPGAVRPALPPPVTFAVQEAGSPIEVDGVLDEPAWASALVVPVAYEWAPGDITREPGRYSVPVAAHSRRLFTQLLFSYKLNPQTVLFLGYSDNSTAERRGADLLRVSRSFFVKLGYAWVL